MTYPIEKSRAFVLFRPRSSFRALGLAAVVAVATACSDTADPEPDDHAEAEGVQLLIGGRAVATYDGDDQSWTGGLTVGAGEESEEITVRFVDHDGDAVPIDDDLYLEVSVADEDVAEFHADEPGAFEGHLDGVAEGETTAVFRLMHGAVGSGHADFETTPVQVRVTGPA